MCVFFVEILYKFFCVYTYCRGASIYGLGVALASFVYCPFLGQYGRPLKSTLFCFFLVEAAFRPNVEKKITWQTSQVTERERMRGAHLHLFASLWRYLGEIWPVKSQAIFIIYTIRIKMFRRSTRARVFVVKFCCCFFPLSGSQHFLITVLAPLLSSIELQSVLSM